MIESQALSRDINPESRVTPLPGPGSVRRLSGTVIDSATRAPVYYAHVALQRDDVTYVVITDADGRYAADVHPGDYVLDVTRKGYERQVAEIAVGDDVVLDFAIADVGAEHQVGPDRDHKTIQAALDIANDGDTIHLDPRRLRRGRSRSSPTSRSGERVTTARASSARPTATSPSRRSSRSTTRRTGPTA